MSSPDSPQSKLVYDWSRGFGNKDLATLEKHLHRDYRAVTYPQSLKHPEQTKEEWLARMAKIFPYWSEYKNTVHSITEAPGKVITHFTTETKLLSGIDNVYEAIVIAHIITDDDGSLKIIKIEEFVDSRSYLDLMDKMRGSA